MAISATDAAYTYNTGSKNPAAASTNGSFSTEDFFALLAAQLENQSMYDTVDNTEFISQMLQFTNLSQMQELTSGMQMAYSVSLIGKNVTILAVDENGISSQVTGSVDSVVYDSGTPYVCVGGQYYTTDSIVGIQEGSGAEENQNAIAETIRDAIEELGRTIGGRTDSETGEETDQAANEVTGGGESADAAQPEEGAGEGSGV
jgi:flagellar basal-body rod modification protein FlgD